MSQGLEPPFVLLEDPSLVPGNPHQVTYSLSTHIHSACMSTYTHTHTQIKIQSKKL